ncbi:MAG: PKD domain-containing protein, partial [Chitinophagaceae bacterium]
MHPRKRVFSCTQKSCETLAPASISANKSFPLIPPRRTLSQARVALKDNPKTNLMRKHQFLLLLALLCLGIRPAQSQGNGRTLALQADFSATPRSGCAPLVVSFTDHTSGSPLQWRWELGNGVVSTQQNPSTIYVNPGTYAVKLKVTNTQGADSVLRTAYITVYEAPTVAFGSPDLLGCAPFTATFADSGSSSLPVVERRWDFGDGTLGDGSTPAHTYQSAGLYGVSLKVTNSAGCSKTLTRPQYVRVSGKPQAAFTNSNASRCTVPHSVQFTATGGASSQYAWDFGDGTTASGAAPSHTYTTAGSYTVSLIATNASGCRDTIRKTALVQVGASAAFQAPDTICVHSTVAFINQSNPVAPVSAWTFGDGSASGEVFPIKTFDVPGTYTVELRNVYADCRDSIRHTIVVKPGPEALFTTVDTFSCTAPYAVRFSNSSTDALTYRWDFGDGSTSTEASPVHTYASTGTFTVRLIATGSTGCADTLERTGYVRVQAPQLAFGGLPVSGCAPQMAVPTVSVSGGSAISGWNWSFGDGRSATDAAPSHTWSAAGSYTVSVTVTTANGCTVTDSLPNAAQVFNKPQASFDLSPGDVCAFQGIQFTNTSANVDSNSSWLWSFGDGTSSTSEDPYHEYDGVGWFSVQLVASNGTCRDTVNRPNVLFVRPPVARFLVALQCSDRYTRRFTNRSIGAMTSTWDFGDGTTSTEQNPVHTYVAPGSYIVKLRVTNDTCYHVRTITVDVYDEKAQFTANSGSLCYGQPYRVTASNFNAAHIRGWSWDFGDGTTESTAGAASHVYTRPGTYTVTLTITDPLGCTSSYAQNVTVRGAIADFTHDGTA